MDRPSRIFQWAQLLALTFVHFYADMFAGMVPALLPEIRAVFVLSLTEGVTLITVLALVCNGFQVLTGHLRAAKSRPLFLSAGVVLAASMCVIGVLPRSGQVEAWLYPMVIVSAIGIAMVHPEGLRAIHALEGIPASLSTAVFLTGGFCGYAGGAWIAAEIVTYGGLAGLLWLGPGALAGLAALGVLRIRLAVEDGQEGANGESNRGGVAFGPILAMAVVSAISTTVIVGLLPTLLNEKGFGLNFGGFSVMLIGVSGAFGSLAWAALAHRRSTLRCCVWSLFLGAPFFAAYQLVLDARWAAMLLAPAGLGSVAAYPLMVTMARHARGGNLGMRMALMVGGAWGAGAVVLWALGPVAERVGVEAVTDFAWTGYLAAGMIGIVALMRTKAVNNNG